MASKRSRVTAMVIALMFFITSVGTSGLILYSLWQNNKQKSAASTTAADGTQSSQKKEGQLQGTKLQNFTPVEKVDELKSEDLVVGTGDEVQQGATVTAHYTGALTKDGTIFQSSHDTGQPVEFSLSSVIPGWTEGVPGMKVGGKRRLLIPAAKAYGEQSPSPDIPPNSDLVFDIEITAVKN